MVMSSIVFDPWSAADVGAYVKVKSAARAGARERIKRAAAARREKRAFMAAGRGRKGREGKNAADGAGDYHKSFSIGTEKN